MRIIRAYNPYHLGDQIYNFILFQKISQSLVSNNIEIHYYCPPQYIKQVAEFISPNVIIYKFPHGISYDGDEFGFRMHIGNDKLPLNLFNYKNNLYDEFYIEFYKQFLRMMNLPISPETITSFDYQDANLLERYNSLDPKFKNIDVLVINSTPQSNQYRAYDKGTWDYCIHILANMGLNVVTTEKVSGVKCTMDNMYTLKTIAAISTGAKVIIAINTGPLSGCFNTYTLSNVKKIYVFDDRNNFAHPKITSARYFYDIDTKEIMSYCTNFLTPKARRRVGSGGISMKL